MISVEVFVSSLVTILTVVGGCVAALFTWARSQAAGRIADRDKAQERLDKFYAERAADKDRQIAALTVERDAFRVELFRALNVARVSTSNTAKVLGLDTGQQGTT
jgi:hypothetical protein